VGRKHPDDLMAQFTCPGCGMHEFVSVPDGRGGTRGVCLGRVPHVPPQGSSPDLPATTNPCGFDWDRTEDTSYFAEP